jgi:hypothetical protein
LLSCPELDTESAVPWGNCSLYPDTLRILTV